MSGIEWSGVAGTNRPTTYVHTYINISIHKYQLHTDMHVPQLARSHLFGDLGLAFDGANFVQHICVTGKCYFRRGGRQAGRQAGQQAAR